MEIWRLSKFKDTLYGYLVNHFSSIIFGEGVDVEIGGGARVECLGHTATVPPPDKTKLDTTQGLLTTNLLNYELFLNRNSFQLN